MTDGIYSDTAAKLLDAGVTTINGTQYQRVLDEEVRKVLAAALEGDESAKITASKVRTCTSMPSFNGNKSIISFGESKEFTGCTSIPDNCFNSCGVLSEFVLPANLRSIGYKAFSGFTFQFSTLQLPNTITSIGREAFIYINGVKKIILPTSLSTVPVEMIDGSSVTIVDIPGESTTISLYAFWASASVTLLVRAATPNVCSTDKALNRVTAIYVPDASVDLYKAADGWSTKASIIKPLSEYVEE